MPVGGVGLVCFQHPLVSTLSAHPVHTPAHTFTCKGEGCGRCVEIECRVMKIEWIQNSKFKMNEDSAILNLELLNIES